nr:hypothetical protein [Corynebacterium sp. TAE3-ERU16]
MNQTQSEACVTGSVTLACPLDAGGVAEPVGARVHHPDRVRTGDGVLRGGVAGALQAERVRKYRNLVPGALIRRQVEVRDL